MSKRPYCLLFLGVILAATHIQSVRAGDVEESRQRSARVATAHRLAAESQNVRESSPSLSLLLAVEALRVTMDQGEPPVTTAHSALAKLR